MNYRKLNIVFLFIICLTSVFALNGCTKENDKVCYLGLTLITKISPETTFPDANSVVNDVVLYIFDEQGNFLEKRPTEIDKVEHIYYPNSGKLTVVAWCSTEDGSVVVTPMSKGSVIDDGLISLKEITNPLLSTVYDSPGDVLHGMTLAQNNLAEEHVTIYVKRKVGAMNITVRGLKEYAGFDDDNYSIVLGTTKLSINFLGQPQAGGAGHAPSGAFNSQGEYIIPNFNLPPSQGETLSVTIYHGTTEIYLTSQDSKGVPFQTVENTTLNVLIEFRSTVNVSIEESEWSFAHEWEKIID